jgi:hypothetical protein
LSEANAPPPKYGDRAAFRHRTRLPEKERFLAKAAYHNSVTRDRNAVIRAYEAVLRVAPDDHRVREMAFWVRASRARLQPATLGEG